jgi:hypothetical protein
MSELIRMDVGDSGSPGPARPAAEPRWPMATAVLAATILYVGMPHRGRVPGWWVFPVVQLVLLGLLIAQDPGRIDRRSAGLQRLMGSLLVVMTTGTVLAVVVLAYDILVAVEGVTATVLLGRGAAIWVENVILFSLWCWQVDRGGPAERAAGSPIPPSLAFPENATPELVPGGVAAGLSGLSVCGLHQRHRVQSDRHPPGPALGQADHAGPVGPVAGHRDPGHRPSHQRPARIDARRRPARSGPTVGFRPGCQVGMPGWRRISAVARSSRTAPTQMST